MPTDERLRTDDREDLQDRQTPSVQLDKEPAVVVREPDATMQPALQDNQLMSKHRVLSFKPQLRLEWRGQDGQSETEQPDHSVSLSDSITSSTRIRFSVHTGRRRESQSTFDISARAVSALPRAHELDKNQLDARCSSCRRLRRGRASESDLPSNLP